MFLANENIPRPSIEMLRGAGFKIISIQDDFSGISDSAVIELALKSKLIILTFDSDYGELIFKYAKDNPPAVISFRDKGADPQFAAKTLIQLISTADLNFDAAFSVMEQRSLRQRFYKK